MFTKEQYDEYIERLQDHCNNYCEKNGILPLHPIDLMLSKIIFDLLCMRAHDDTKEVVARLAYWINQLYAKDKDVIDNIRENLINKGAIKVGDDAEEEIKKLNKFIENKNDFNTYMENLNI